ncbi:SRPBCC family protein [Streptomyces sp. MUM 2J]|uniref:SRPBCC family protein n=1 Tax=Streptomyces sp. MUM 2J TaxID=2791987 RepID=UPI001F04254E|nr:SRPBCC family protein [Streptomyces sp. MUM 2J]MCH0562433.1 SRPBCC family protein [Streptomyces sp. MUM 2J]
MSTLEEHADIGVRADRARDFLHRVENHPGFLTGVREAHTGGGGRARLGVTAGDRTREVDAETTDHDQGRTMEGQTTSGPGLAGSFTLQPVDARHTRLSTRLEYDPAAVRDAFGGPGGFAQAIALERPAHSGLEQCRRLLEQGAR